MLGSGCFFFLVGKCPTKPLSFAYKTKGVWLILIIVKLPYTHHYLQMGCWYLSLSVSLAKMTGISRLSHEFLFKKCWWQGLNPATMCNEGFENMHKLFSTCLLTQDDSLAPEITCKEVNLHPGIGFSPDQGETVLLAGGFSSLASKSGFPLSPTLFLNHALGAAGKEELKAIAQAELTRLNEVQYRSYTVEADNRVCVISKDAENLLRFVDTYGGTLDIEGLLLKEYHPDFSTVIELSIHKGGKNCRLEYQLRTPIDLELCSYCGACGPACPAQCISENLFLDYSACTYCKECESACEAQAIDVHSGTHRIVDVPAVIVLGDIDLDVAEGVAGIYTESTLPDYFATLFPCQIDESIHYTASICQYSAKIGGGCDLCISSCQHGAITQSSHGVTVDYHLCEECGACLASCPTGALQNARFDDKSFYNHVQQISIPTGGTVVIGDEQSLQKLWWQKQGNTYENVLFLEYGNIRSLSMFHFITLLGLGAERIVLLERSDFASAGSAGEKALKLTNEIVEGLFGLTRAVMYGRIDNFDTTLAFSPLGLGLKWPKTTFINRRQALAEGLQYLVRKSGRTLTLEPSGYVPFASVRCDSSSCTQCMACLNECRIAALRADENGLALDHVGIMCVGCGLCAKICPENALKISSSFTLAEQFFLPYRMAEADAMECRSCGKVFGTRKSFERVMAILSQKEKVDTSHFEYCDKCRVVKLFQAE